MRISGVMLIIVIGGAMLADEKKQKPLITVDADGFPTGNTSAEGVACDLARAFIRRDAQLFDRSCIAPFGGGEARRKYESFLKHTAKEIAAEAARKVPSPAGPKSIEKVFAARKFSRSGPASYGFAAFEFQEVLFVDVRVIRHDGDQYLNRTLVIKDRKGNWYAHPMPDSSPLLSAGLNEESASTADFEDVYDKKQK